VPKIAKNSNYTRDPITGQNRFAKGTQIGRMKKKGFTLTDLNKLVRKYEESKDEKGNNRKPLLKHYIAQLFKDNNLLSKYIDKNIPTVSKNEITGKVEHQVKYIIEKTYEGEDGKPKDNPGKTDP